MKNKLMKLAMIVGVLALLASVGLVSTVAEATEYELSLTLENKTGEPDWYVVQDTTSGTLHYNPSGATFDFAFEATGLQPETNYDLIYYTDPWAGDFGAFLATFTTDQSGNIPLTPQSLALNENLPNEPDTNMVENYCEKMCGDHTCNSTVTQCQGAKIWLVLSSDYDRDNTKLIAWNWGSYLFELDLITYQYKPAIGLPSQGTVLPASIGVDISPLNLNFGTIKQGAMSNVLPITISNTGSVNIKATALVTDITGTLGTDCLELSSDGAVWVDSQVWNYTPILAGTSKVVYARLNVPSGYPLGTFTFTTFFLIQVAP